MTGAVGAVGPLVRVAHVIPGRVRLRIVRLRWAPGLGAAVEARLLAVPGVGSVRIAVVAASVVIEHDPRAADIASLVRAARAGALDPPPPAAPLPLAAAPPEEGASRRPLYLSSAAMLFAVAAGGFGPLLAFPLLVATAAPIFRRAFHAVARRRRPNVDVLDALALVTAAATGDVVNAAGIVWLVTLGDHIRDLTQARARRAIRGLLEYQQDVAWVERGETKVRIPVAELCVGDVVVVYSGGVIPVDGVAARGAAVVDQQSLTGESVPVLKEPGDRCFAASVVKEGKLYVRAERVGGDTKAARTVQLIEDAPALETRAQSYAEAVADRLVAPALGCAGAVLVATWDLNRLAAILTVDFGTGPRVSAPTTVLASMNAAARRGVLIKGGAHLERLARVSTVVFDKTGTLTRGVPEITDVVVHAKGLSERDAAALAAAVSARQTHPVSLAVLRLAEAWGLEIPQRDASRHVIGRGVQASVGGRVVHLGSARFLGEVGAPCRADASLLRRLSGEAKSLLFLAVDGAHAATLAHRDALRPEALPTLKALRARGIDDLVMLTGDSYAVAREVASSLDIRRVHAEVLPEEKADITRRLSSEGRIVAVVGDGINDSPALAYADVGISMSAAAEIAREAAGVVLMEDDLSRLIDAIDVSRRAMRIIRQGFGLMLGANALAYALAIPGLLSPIAATLLNNGSAVLACVYGLHPLLAAHGRPRR